ncbi:hypothetical protein KXX32_000762, partial [Aspergillus fumigatus]
VKSINSGSGDLNNARFLSLVAAYSRLTPFTEEVWLGDGLLGSGIRPLWGLSGRGS